MWRRTHGHDRGWKCCWPNRWSHYNWTQELRLCQLRAPIARVCGVIVDIRRDASGSGRSRGRSGEQAVRRILLTQVRTYIHTYIQAMHACVCAPRTWNSSCCCCYCCSYISSLGARLCVCVCDCFCDVRMYIHAYIVHTNLRINLSILCVCVCVGTCRLQIICS